MSGGDRYVVTRWEGGRRLFLGTTPLGRNKWSPDPVGADWYTRRSDAQKVARSFDALYDTVEVEKVTWSERL